MLKERGGSWMQSSFKTMTVDELRAYAIAHRDEIEPLWELYRHRTPDEEAMWYYPPQTKEEEREQFEQFKRAISKRESRKK